MFAWLRKLFTLLYDQAGWTTEMTVTGVADVDEAIPEQVNNAPYSVMSMRNAL